MKGGRSSKQTPDEYLQLFHISEMDEKKFKLKLDT